MAITVKSSVLEAAKLLGIWEEVSAYVNGGTNTVGERDTKLLTTCFRLVETELALDYLPLVAEEEVVTTAGVLQYSDLRRVALRILSVKDEWGKPVRFKLYPKHMEVPTGSIKVYYAYEPTEKGLTEESEYQSERAARLLAYGMAAEYALAVGEFESAKAWSQRYKEGVEAERRVRPSKQIRSRRWC